MQQGERQNGKLTDYVNGDRYVYAQKEHLTNHPLPRFSICGLFQCRIFHFGQKHNVQCTNCQKIGHTAYSCKSTPVCAACKDGSHTAGTSPCSFYEPQVACRTFSGHSDPLSNFFDGTFFLDNISFTSAEQAYQYKKALMNGMPDLASKILKARTASEAKSLARYITCISSWEQENTRVMEAILDAKFQQVPRAKKALLSSGDKILVEAVEGQFFWGSGMPAEATFNTKREAWPGKNTLGEILMRIRNKFQQSSTTQCNSLDQNRPTLSIHTSVPRPSRDQRQQPRAGEDRRGSFKGRKLSGNVSQSPSRRRKLSDIKSTHGDHSYREEDVARYLSLRKDAGSYAESEGEYASDFEARYSYHSDVK